MLQKGKDKMNDTMREIFGDNIFTYTRAMAIADGVLIDISTLANEAGFKYPVAVTEALYNEYLEPDEESKHLGQSSSGRIWDMLIILHVMSKCCNRNTMYFKVIIAGKNTSKEVKAVIGPGDNSDPVLTIMLPHED